MADLSTLLAEFGADPSSLRLLDDECPELLPYATLMTARRNRHATLGIVAAVYEWQGAPLVFLIDADSRADDGQLQRIRRLLAMRGDAPYLGVVAPGSLRIYRIALDSKTLRQARVRWDEEDSARSTVFARLGNVRPQAAITNRGWISNVVLSLLSGSTTGLIKLKVSHEDAISLVGRALLTRFLADRSLLPDDMSEPATAASLFDFREIAEETSNWLDTTFNGDLLPLSVDIFDRLPAAGYRILGDVLRRAPDGQLFLGWKKKWANLDFAHIPVGILSQAYELYLREHAPAKQKREGRLLHAQTDCRADGSRVVLRARTARYRQVGQGSRSRRRRRHFPAHGIPGARCGTLAGRWKAAGYRHAQADPLQADGRASTSMRPRYDSRHWVCICC